MEARSHWDETNKKLCAPVASCEQLICSVFNVQKLTLPDPKTVWWAWCQRYPGLPAVPDQSRFLCTLNNFSALLLKSVHIWRRFSGIECSTFNVLLVPATPALDYLLRSVRFFYSFGAFGVLCICDLSLVAYGKFFCRDKSFVNFFYKISNNVNAIGWVDFIYLFL